MEWFLKKILKYFSYGFLCWNLSPAGGPSLSPGSQILQYRIFTIYTSFCVNNCISSAVVFEKKIFKHKHHILTVSQLFHFEKGLDTPFPNWCFVPSLIKIDPEEVKNVKSLQMDRYTGNGCSEMLLWIFGSGELKKNRTSYLPSYMIYIFWQICWTLQFKIIGLRLLF